MVTFSLQVALALASSPQTPKPQFPAKQWTSIVKVGLAVWAPNCKMQDLAVLASNLPPAATRPKAQDYANNQLPLLDACGAHFGPTPESSSNVYHYHVQDQAAFSVLRLRKAENMRLMSESKFCDVNVSLQVVSRRDTDPKVLVFV